MFLAWGMLPCDQVPVRLDIEQHLIVAEPGATLQCDSLKVHLLILPVEIPVQMNLATVDEDQVFKVLPDLEDLMTTLVHPTSQMDHNLLYELRRSVPIVKVIFEEKTKSFYYVTEDFIHQLLLKLWPQLFVKFIAGEALLN